MRRASVLLAMAALATVTFATAARAGDGDDARARKLLEDAFNRRYRWAEDFRGFSAEFSYDRDGRTVHGTVSADLTKPRGGVQVTCDDETVKKAVQSTIASTVTHTRASRFEAAFGDCGFAIGGERPDGATKIKLSGHAFFTDFTVKDGHIVENHGASAAMGMISSEVSVRQVVWMADSGKTLPREYTFRVTRKAGERTVEETGKTLESWREVEGVWLPSTYHLTRTEGSTSVESTLRLANIKVARGK